MSRLQDVERRDVEEELEHEVVYPKGGLRGRAAGVSRACHGRVAQRRAEAAQPKTSLRRHGAAEQREQRAVAAAEDELGGLEERPNHARSEQYQHLAERGRVSEGRGTLFEEGLSRGGATRTRLGSV